MSEDKKILDVQDAADPGSVADALLEKAGPRLAEMVGEAVRHEVKDLGLDRVDRKHGIFPGVEGADDPAAGLAARTEKFLRAAILGTRDVTVEKALSEGSDAAGGYLVPDDFRSEVIMRTNELSVLYPRCKRFTTGRDSIKVPNLATDVTMSWDEAENADFDESDPVFGQTSFTIHRCNAITKTSRELVADSAVNIVDLLTTLFADAISRERDKMVVIGDGSTQPEGIFSATGVTTVSSIGAVTYAKLLEIDENIAEEYRRDPSLCWITNQTVRRYVRGLTDDNSRPILERPMERGAPYTLLDHPLLINPNVPAGYLALGVLNKYWIMDREQVGIESTTSGGEAFRKHQIWLKVWERWDGKLVQKTSSWCIGSGITS